MSGPKLDLKVLYSQYLLVRFHRSLNIYNSEYWIQITWCCGNLMILQHSIEFATMYKFLLCFRNESLFLSLIVLSSKLAIGVFRLILIFFWLDSLGVIYHPCIYFVSVISALIHINIANVGQKICRCNDQPPVKRRELQAKCNDSAISKEREKLTSLTNFNIGSRIWGYINDTLAGFATTTINVKMMR